MGSQNYIYDESKLKNVNFVTKDIKVDKENNSYIYKENKKMNKKHFIK